MRMHMLEFRRHLALPAMESARVLNMHMYMHTNVTLTLTPGHRAPAELAARPSLLIARFSASSSASTSPAVCNLPFNALRVNALRVIVHTSTRVNAYRLSHIAYRVCNSHPHRLTPDGGVYLPCPMSCAIWPGSRSSFAKSPMITNAYSI